jgi:hypothetical protein
MSKWRAHGFTQRKPRLPGVYFISQDHQTLNPPLRIRFGWDIAEVRFTAGGWGNEHDQREEFAHWRVKTLDGLDMAWRKGLWMKGPIDPFAEISSATEGTNTGNQPDGEQR